MDGESQRRDESAPHPKDLAGALEAVREALGAANEADRYQLLAGLFAELAGGRASAPLSGPSAEADALSRRVQALSEEKATLQDQLAAARADLDHRNSQLEAEQKRAREFEAIIQEQRGRLKTLKTQAADLEAQVVAKNAELHKSHAEQDQLLLKAQRAELGRDDRAKVDRLETARRDAGKEVEAVRAELEQLRADRDAKIAALEQSLAAARDEGVAEAEICFGDLWTRLASAKPALVEGHVKPTKQAAERLVDALIELIRFVDDFDKLIRPFLSKYTKHHQPVKVPWEVYARRDDTLATVRQTLAAVGGKPVGVVKIRLRGLYAWTEAAMIACDATIESVAAELHEFLHGKHGIGADPNRTIKDFVREDGHELFLQHLRELRGLRLAEAFGRRG
jgi:hypothetical protein